MTTSTRTRRRRIGLLAALIGLVAGATGAATGTGAFSFANAASSGTATTGKADYTLSVSPNSQAAQVGKSVAYTVTVTGVNGFTGSVSLSAAASPATGLTISPTAGSPTTVSLTSGGSIRTATVNVAVGRSAAVDSRPRITVTGTSGRTSKSASAELVVQKTPGSLALSASPVSVNVAAGGSAALNVALNRTGSMTEVAVPLSLESAQPGISGAFSPVQPTGSTSSLLITTTGSTPTGTYPVTVVGTVDGVRYTAGASVTVVYESRSFTITGSVTTPLSPGSDVAMDLELRNPNNRAVSVTNITGVVSTGKEQCPADNFSFVQYKGLYPLALPAGTTRTLTQLGVAPADLPRLRFLNLNRNQDGCKSPTSVRLTYSGSGTGN